MLILCPECSAQISNKAVSCPLCGYPMHPYKSFGTPSRRKHARLPNGFGQITKITSKNLSRPYRAMVTVDKTVEGKPVCALLKPVAYFKTYNEAYEALLEYNSKRGVYFGIIPFKNVYEEWYDKTSPKRSRVWCRTTDNCYRYCKNIHDSDIGTISIKDIKDAMSNIGAYHMRECLRDMINSVFKYALNQQYISKNPFLGISIDIGMDKPDTQHHKSFTDEEMKALWAHTDDKYVRIILIGCYSGWRPSELLNLKLGDVNISNETMRGGMKTDAGKNRIVPIHSAIYQFVCDFYVYASKCGSEYLFSSDAAPHLTKIPTTTYRRRFLDVMTEYGLDITHSPHDCRKQFITMGKKYDMDEYAIKRIVGHAITDITENVYTDRDISWLKSQIEKIIVGV